MATINRTVYLYKVENALLAASGTWEVDYGQNGVFVREEYAPFNTVLITNNSSSDIDVRLDRSSTKSFTILLGQTLSIAVEDGILFYDLDIVNRDAVNAIAANLLTVVVSKVKRTEV